MSWVSGTVLASACCPRVVNGPLLKLRSIQVWVINHIVALVMSGHGHTLHTDVMRVIYLSKNLAPCASTARKSAVG